MISKISIENKKSWVKITFFQLNNVSIPAAHGIKVERTKQIAKKYDADISINNEVGVTIKPLNKESFFRDRWETGEIEICNSIQYR